MRSSGWALTQYNQGPREKGKGRKRWRDREKAVWSPRQKTRRAWEPPGARAERRTDPLAALGKNQPCPHPDFGLLASRTVRYWISVISSHTVWGTLLQRLEERIQTPPHPFARLQQGRQERYSCGFACLASWWQWATRQPSGLDLKGLGSLWKMLRGEGTDHTCVLNAHFCCRAENGLRKHGGSKTTDQ